MTIIRGVLDELGLDRVDIVGQSIGGIWALHAARADGNRIGALVLLGGMPNPEVPLPAFIKLLRSPIGAIMVRAPMRPGMLHKQLEALGHGADPCARRHAGLHGLETGLPAPHAVDAPRARHGAGDHDRGWFSPRCPPRRGALADLAQPTLMVFGTADPAGTSELWRRYVERLPDGRLELVADAGHNVFWDDPGGVGGTVRRFLER